MKIFLAFLEDGGLVFFVSGHISIISGQLHDLGRIICPPPEMAFFPVQNVSLVFYTDFTHFLVFFHQAFYVTYFYNVDKVFLGTFVKKKLFFWQ